MPWPDPSAVDNPTVRGVIKSAHLDAVNEALDYLFEHALGSDEEWTTYTPALTAATTSPTLGSGSSAVGRYFKQGRKVTFWARITFGTSGVAAGSGAYRFGLPVNADTTYLERRGMHFEAQDSSASAYLTHGFASIGASSYAHLFYGAAFPSGSLSQVSNSVPWTWAASDRIDLWGTYESTV